MSSHGSRRTGGSGRSGPARASTSAGSMSGHGSKRSGQRVVNLQPSGRSRMSGTDAGNRRAAARAFGPSTRGSEPSSPRVYGCSGLLNSSLDRRDLLDLAAVHHRHAIARLGDDGEVVGDEQDRGVLLPLLHLQHQVENLRLDRHVERRRRLVGDQQVGVQRERHGDHDALPLPPGELMRILLHPRSAVGDADQVEHLDAARRTPPASRSSRAGG